ncbi:MAG: sigma-54-dependent Fis family transcriptional regulator [Calditrichaeota bacterium]|nr:sigma-54-dependent Fis family transcriptional regulator [Calditrichota bacterium]
MPNQTIFVVDDDPSVNKILGKILSGEGFRVLDASTGKEALEVFSENEFDLILMDMLLPDADGVELAQQMLAAKPHVPVILITAHGNVPKAVEAIKLGLYDFLEKPFDRERLMITIKNALSWGEAQQQLLHYKQDSLADYKMVGQSDAMRKVYSMIDKIAPSPTPVLILGENGVGKELVAQAIHNKSPRAKKQMVKINCPAIPDTLLESELFGHTKGAFTGAHTAHNGRLLMADNSTLFLDEIGDLSLDAQAKLLRFLDSGEIQRVGSSQTVQVDVRIIAATNKDLLQMVHERTFRQDLYYRLEVFPLIVPPLRLHREDIPLLLDHFISEYAAQKGTLRPSLSPTALHYLASYDWPGNIRQLQHLVERMLILFNQEIIDLEHVRFLLTAPAGQASSAEVENRTLSSARKNFEKEHILAILAKTNGNMTKAARILGVDRANLYRKMEGLGIKGKMMLI